MTRDMADELNRGAFVMSGGTSVNYGPCGLWSTSVLLFLLALFCITSCSLSFELSDLRGWILKMLAPGGRHQLLLTHIKSVKLLPRRRPLNFNK